MNGVIHYKNAACMYAWCTRTAFNRFFFTPKITYIYELNHIRPQSEDVIDWML